MNAGAKLASSFLLGARSQPTGSYHPRVGQSFHLGERGLESPTQACPEDVSRVILVKLRIMAAITAWDRTHIETVCH